MTRIRIAKSVKARTADKDWLIRRKILRTVIADILRSNRERLHDWLVLAARIEESRQTKRPQ